MTLRTVLSLAAIMSSMTAVGQEREHSDPCGTPDSLSALYRAAMAPAYGYGYDTLREDLGRWAMSPFVRIDSIGESVQHRGLFMLTIQDTSTSLTLRRRVWIHARTHPNEVQGSWVTNEIIALLLSENPLARALRSACVFNVLPMYNPDGVELMRDRQNANGVDIESNWAVVPGEPEVRVLRAQFATLMSTTTPIVVALNMHSAYGTDRYFVYHAETGTSPVFAAREQAFIDGVRAHFPGGIKPWNFFVSWVNGPSTSYPESWFWQNHREAVMALTYEDMNSPAARAFDSTAYAIVHGIGDFLGVTSPTAVREMVPLARGGIGLWCYPNPFNGFSEFGFGISDWGMTRVVVYDLLGREVSRVVDRELGPGTYTARLDLGSSASGMYVIRLVHGNESRALRVLLAR